MMNYDLLASMASVEQSNGKLMEEFRRLRNRAVRRQWWAALTGKRYDLLSLYERQMEATKTSRYAGIQLVPIAKIRGSASRVTDFDAGFRPLQMHNSQRWVNIAQAYHREEALPPVELVQIGEIYFVNDGHHRISVAKLLGQQEIEAEVTVIETRMNAGIHQPAMAVQN
jgi:hypothetical protein